VAAASTISAGFIDELTSTISAGDAQSLRGMLPAMYDELRRIAGGFLRDERPDHTLQATALVHEAYMRMLDQRLPNSGNRAQLLGLFARMMRRILLDHAEARVAAKRGGKDAVKLALDEALDVYDEHALKLTDVEDALRRLEKIDPVQARLVELRFFGGLTIEELADVLDISPTSVKREWSIAKRWLQRELSAEE
jgi:RNA polymerase sigma-70 factor (ECF subfamily)